MDREILIVSSEQKLYQQIENHCKFTSPQKIHISLVHNIKSAADHLRKNAVALVIIGRLPNEENVISFLFYIWQSFPDIPIFNVTGEQEFPESLIIEEDGLTLRSNQKKLPLQKWPAIIKKALKREQEGGFLKVNDVSNFAQMIENEVRTCTIRIFDHTDSRLGVLFFEKGILKNARLKTVQGEVAANAILSWDNVKVWIQDSCEISSPKITSNLQALLIESHVKKDHNCQASSDSATWISASKEERERYRKLAETSEPAQHEMTENTEDQEPLPYNPIQHKKKWPLKVIPAAAVCVALILGFIYYIAVDQKKGNEPALAENGAMIINTKKEERPETKQGDKPKPLTSETTPKNPRNMELLSTNHKKTNKTSPSQSDTESVADTLAKSSTTEQTPKHSDKKNRNYTSQMPKKETSPADPAPLEQTANGQKSITTEGNRVGTPSVKSGNDQRSPIERSGSIYIHYTHRKNRSVAYRLADYLMANNYQVPKVERVAYKNNDIRYFHIADVESAAQLKKVLLNFISTNAPNKKMARLKIKNLAKRYPKETPGQLEIWLNLSEG